MKKKNTYLFLTASSTLLAMCAAHADQTWDGGGTDNNWNSAANWGGNTLPNFANQIIFAGTTRTTAVNNLTEDTIIGGISFTNQTTPQTFTLSGNRITLGGNIVGAQFAGGGQQNAANTDTIQLAMVLNGNRSFTTGARRTFNFSGVISETGGARNLSTSGSIQLSAANTFSGTTTITSGLLHLSNALALQNTALDTTSSVAGLRVTSGVTTLTFGGLIGNKNFQSASGGIFNQTAMNSGGAHIGGSSAANNYSTVTAITLNPSESSSRSYSGAITNGAANMTLTKTGLGTQILSGANTYTGATAINAGTLRINGSTHTSSAFTVASGATLAGAGTVGGTVAATGIIAPGNGTAAIGTLSVSRSVTWNSGNAWQFDLASSGTSSDTLALTGTGANGVFTKGSGSTFQFDFMGSTPAANAVFTLATFASSSGFSVGDFSATNLAGANASGTFTLNPTSLTFTAVPEASNLLIGGLVGLGLLKRRRKNA